MPDLFMATLDETRRGGRQKTKTELEMAHMERGTLGAELNTEGRETRGATNGTGRKARNPGKHAVENTRPSAQTGKAEKSGMPQKRKRTSPSCHSRSLGDMRGMQRREGLLIPPRQFQSGTLSLLAFLQTKKNEERNIFCFFQISYPQLHGFLITAAGLQELLSARRTEEASRAGCACGRAVDFCVGPRGARQSLDRLLGTVVASWAEMCGVSVNHRSAGTKVPFRAGTRGGCEARAIAVET
ncbi:hypothetical protein TGDOM2_400370 [Toxoplasma gondii GAB2-2007-GAL-DOM2]|uniref:Uncharacterized protein n=1 Tax=Toxoplasma gondii GAB2-2007-GAL-DOM2 TaxID=1130820 RepID=A0A086JSQ4_TOXGO|nr:hypothetical protein TGDOM2_400370 [Toxoplasma gondii GAB2-2007-GAL-DOM2]